MLKSRYSSKCIKVAQFIIILVLFSTPFNVLRAEAIVINFPVDNQKSSAVRAMALKFQELVAQRIGDETIQVNVYKLGERDLFEQMRLEKAQMIAPKLSRFKRYSKRIQVFELPFLFYSGRAAEDFLDGVWGDRLLRVLQKKEIFAYGYIHEGMRHITSSESIVKPSQLEKKSLGIFYSNTAKKYFKSLKAKVVSLNPAEVDVAIRSERVNVTENNWTNIYEQELYKKHQYILESNHAYSGNVLVMSKRILEKTSPEVQEQLKQLINESIVFGNDQMREKNARFRQLIINSKTNVVHELSASERYAWIEAARELWTSFENEIGAQLIDAAASHR